MVVHGRGRATPICNRYHGHAGRILIGLDSRLIPDILTTIGAVTRDGLTPLGLAVSKGHLHIMKFLIKECNVAVNGKLV